LIDNLFARFRLRLRIVFPFIKRTDADPELGEFLERTESPQFINIKEVPHHWEKRQTRVRSASEFLTGGFTSTIRGCG